MHTLSSSIAVTLATALAAVLTAPAQAEPASYTLDPGHTFVHWEVLHLGTSTTRGRFDRVSGNVAFDAATQQIDIGITVDTASVNTGFAGFDTLLRGTQLLASGEHPQAYFTARQAQWRDGAPQLITGEITLRGSSRPLALRALRWRCGLNPLFGREVCGGDFEAELQRSDFGITHSLPFVADRVRVLVQVEAVRQ